MFDILFYVYVYVMDNKLNFVVEKVVCFFLII